MNSFGNNIRITIFGASHAPELGCTIEGLPAGARIDMREVNRMLVRRSAKGGGPGATLRQEEDLPRIVSGSENGIDGAFLVADGGPLTAVFRNRAQRSGDYGVIARPSHADYVSRIKYGAEYDLSGGGMSSGRMTLPMVFAGAVCSGLLKEKGVTVLSHVLRIGGVSDARFDPMAPALAQGSDPKFPLVDTSVRPAMEAEIASAKAAGDTLPCECECAATGLPVGLGEPFFDGLESTLSHLLFAIPGLRSVEFGDCTSLRGSLTNDPFTEGGRTLTNRSGGVNGGLANGMPLVFRCGFRPVPSISLPQTGFDLEKNEPAELIITGRHDACILPRGCAAVEAAAAIALYDLTRYENE